MPQFIALWTKPDDDVEGFEEHYRTTHTDLVKQWPGFQAVRTYLTPKSPFGDPKYHIVTVVDLDDLGTALNSAEAKAAVDDAKNLMQKHGTSMDVVIGGEL